MIRIITKEEVEEIQQKWAKSLVRIGKLFLEKEDYQNAAAEHVDYFYGYR